ncbi:hypothetical protein BGI23_03125 [Bacillus sp. ABP14]|nr:hypothetical protein BGI23_03125 [Bacillus sp. ABP14]
MFFKSLKYTPYHTYPIPIQGILMVFYQRFLHYVNLHLPIQWKYGVMQKKIKDFKQWLKQFKTS